MKWFSGFSAIIILRTQPSPHDCWAVEVDRAVADYNIICYVCYCWSHALVLAVRSGVYANARPRARWCTYWYWMRLNELIVRRGEAQTFSIEVKIWIEAKFVQNGDTVRLPIAMPYANFVSSQHLMQMSGVVGSSACYNNNRSAWTRAKSSASATSLLERIETPRLSRSNQP